MEKKERQRNLSKIRIFYRKEYTEKLISSEKVWETFALLMCPKGAEMIFVNIQRAYEITCRILWI